jgi:hypothetical protein
MAVAIDSQNVQQSSASNFQSLSQAATQAAAFAFYVNVRVLC